VLFDPDGAPLRVGPAAEAFGARWGGDEFWKAVGRRLRALGPQRPLVLSMHLESGSGAPDQPVAVIVGVRAGAGRIAGVLVTCSEPPASGDGRGAEQAPGGRGSGMDLRELVHALTDLIWSREQNGQPSVETAVLSYVQDAVAAEVEYRRRMRDLDRRLVELEGVRDAAVSS
jgi:hypothetical protein